MRNDLSPLCFDCARLRGVVAGVGWACDAYPAGIPVPILVNKADHRGPYEGDHGLLFEPHARLKFAALAGHEGGDAEWEESKHPRGQPGNAGQFGLGGGGGKKADTKLVSLSPYEEKIAKEYGEGGGAHWINKYLRDPAAFKKQNPGPRTAAWIKSLQKDAKTMDGAIEKSRLTQDVTLYRGVIDFSGFDNSKPGEEFSLSTFSSTSRSKEWAQEFAEFRGRRGGLIVIDAPKGSHALDMALFARHGSDEDELLLPRNSKFRVENYDSGRRELHVTLITDDHREPYEGDGGLLFVEKDEGLRQRFARLAGHPV